MFSFFHKLECVRQGSLEEILRALKEIFMRKTGPDCQQKYKLNIHYSLYLDFFR